MQHKARLATAVDGPGLAASLATALAPLMAGAPPTVAALERTLRSCLDQASPDGDVDERRLRRLVAHLLFQLRDGATLFQACRHAQDSWLRRLLTVERVMHGDEGMRKVYATLALHPRPSDPHAFHEYLGLPSIVIYNNPLTLAAPATAPSHDAAAALDDDELVEFFRNRQAIADAIEQGRIASAGSMLQHQAEDRALIRATFSAVLSTAPAAVALDRVRHPYRPPCLHVLPRLIEPMHHGSVLACIENSLPRIRAMGFGGILLGVVDRQTVGVHYGGAADGTMTPYVNNHGYWSSGETGIDPLLGSAAAYASLAARCRAVGLFFMQDAVFGTLGYPAQVRRMAQSALARPERCVMLGDEESDICDSVRFLHELCIDEEDGLGPDVTPEHYAAVLLHAHMGSPFALPKPNLYRPEVRAAVLRRTEWQIRHAGVDSFRIDMAKHIGVQPLRALLASLRGAVAASAGTACSAVLEYWTVNYRDLAFGARLLGDQGGASYFYDFPLAHALQQMLVCGGGFAQHASWVLTERARWNIAPAQLVPLFIDHDFNFRPIYNGSGATRAVVVVGYALAMMLSANGCHVYYGYQDARAGVPDMAHYFHYTELHARCSSTGIFEDEDSASPAGPVAALFGVFEQYGILRHWDGGAIGCEGGHDVVVLTRRCREPGSGRRFAIRACFARGPRQATPPAGGTTLFEFAHGPSVVISLVPEQDGPV